MMRPTFAMIDMPIKHTTMRRLTPCVIAALMLFARQPLQAQVLRTPDIWWTLDDIQNHGGLIHELNNPDIHGNIFGTAQFVTDRKTQAGKALHLGANSYVMFPTVDLSNLDRSFFGLGRIPEEVTITCWIKITIGNSFPRREIFAGDQRLGMSLISDTLALRRHTGQTVVSQPWDLKLLESLDAIQTSGWYYVALVYAPFYSHVYVGKQGSQTMTCSFNFMGTYTQSWAPITEYMIGSKSGSVIEAIDDFKIWGSVVGQQDLYNLFVQDNIDPYAAGRISGSNTPGDAQEQAAVPEEVEETLTVHPNPAHNKLTIVVRSGRDQHAILKIFTLSGNTVWSQEATLTRGDNIVQFPSISKYKLSPGAYLVMAEGQNGLRLETKLIIE